MTVGRNTSYNLVGAIVPMLLALVTIPLYLNAIGPERYGIVSIAWLLLGYFGVFDLGLSRATAQHIAAKHDRPPEERARTLWTAIVMNAAMGSIGALALWCVGRWYFATQLDTTEVLRREILAAVPLLALSVPVATISGVMLGALQGRERFLEINVVSTLSTTALQIFPLAVAMLYSSNLSLLLAASVAARLLMLAVLWFRCRVVVIGNTRPQFDRTELRSLVRYGGWVALTSLAAPLLVLGDRFIIGAVVGAVAVTIYTVPYQLAQRLSVIGGSLGNALFPRLAASHGKEQDLLASRATHALASLMTLPTLLGIILLDPFLELWVGANLSVQSAPIGKVLLIGFWFNAFAIIPYVQLQAKGRPDLVAKILFLEVPFYLMLMVFAVYRIGLVGAALVFSVRCAVDYALLARGAGHRFTIGTILAPSFAILIAGAVGSSFYPIPQTYGFVILLTLMLFAALIGWMGAPPELKMPIGEIWRRFQARRQHAGEN